MVDLLKLLETKKIKRYIYYLSLKELHQNVRYIIITTLN